MKTEKKSRKARWMVLFTLLAVLAASLLYNLVDNQRFVVVEQEIVIARLPASFDGFRILQISDLHGSTFGKNQADLIDAINQIDYDMIALTGDMNASGVGDSPEESRAILDVLDGISNKEFVFWIDGNSGPTAKVSFASALTGKLTEIGRLLEEKGCKILMLPYVIRRGDDKIWIAPEMSEAAFSSWRATFEDENFAAKLEKYPGLESFSEETVPFYEEAYAAFQAIRGNDEVKILLSHHPRQINLSAEDLSGMGDLDYDLILAGHTHGGQLRLPWIGALYIPSPTTGINNSGFFPDPRAVKGLSSYGEVPQYVSAGLGASGHVRLLSFRSFNTPEINVITIRRLGDS